MHAAEIYFSNSELSIERRLSVAHGICKDCELDGKCDRKKQKILDCNMKVIEYYTEIQNGFCQYPYRGNLHSQANWFKSLYIVLSNEIKKIQKRESDKQQQRISK